MIFLDAALALMLILAGTAVLAAPHLLLLAAGVAAGALSLLVTYGHVVFRRRPAREAAPEPARVGGSFDVAPAEPLAVAPMDGRTAAGVALGAAGLFLFNVIFGALAIGLGVAALRRGTPGRWGRPGAILGIGLGVADFVILAVLIVGRIDGAGLHWS